MAKAKVVEIQIGGGTTVNNLEVACREFVKQRDDLTLWRTKICFVIKLPNGEYKQITIRDEDDQTVAYGDFKELPGMLDYAKEVVNEEDNHDV